MNLPYKCLLVIVFQCVFTLGYSQCPTLVWSEEFNSGSLSTANWNYNVGYPGVNNELETYTSRPQNVTVSGGNLVITALKENYGGYNYTSGKIDTYGKHSFKYGRMEARIKLPATQGLWPAFWMMPQNSVYGGWPTSGEIDIMEELGANPYKTFGTIHYGSSAATHTSSGSTFTSFSNLSEGFHTYAVEWKPDTITWYIDNHNFYTVTKTSIAPNAWPFDQEFYFILNLAVGGWFGGNPDGTTVFPQTMEVDYVRVYSNPQTINISGKDMALATETYTYSVNAPKSTSFNWSVPTGSTIKSGQGTNTITMTWGNTTGDISVITNTTTCGTTTSSLTVPVFPNTCKLVFNDFEANSTKFINYQSSTGTTYNGSYANPSVNSVNSSSTVAFYQRNSIQYDLLYFATDAINNSVDYENQTQQLYMNVYTDAPIGTKINWQLENKARTAQPYPSGRRAVFIGTTTKQNSWEKIKFTFNSTPDLSTSATSIDQFTFLFSPNTYTTNYFYIDSIMRVSSSTASCISTPIPASVENTEMDQQFTVSPNPATDHLTLSYQNLPGSTLKIKLVDMLGTEKSNQEYATPGNSLETTMDISSLTPGIYLIVSQSGEQKFRTRKIIVQ